MFRFAKALDLHDETSWSAWRTRRRRSSSFASGASLSSGNALNSVLVRPTNFVRPTEAASGTPKDCAYVNAAFAKLQKPPRGPGRAPQLGR